MAGVRAAGGGSARRKGLAGEEDELLQTCTNIPPLSALFPCCESGNGRPQRRVHGRRSLSLGLSDMESRERRGRGDKGLAKRSYRVWYSVFTSRCVCVEQVMLFSDQHDV